VGVVLASAGGGGTAAVVALAGAAAAVDGAGADRVHPIEIASAAQAATVRIATDLNHRRILMPAEARMSNRTVSMALVAGLAAVVGLGPAAAQQAPVKIPNPGVPEVMTLEDKYVRVAYNNEGYVTLGYQLANASVGQEWMLLEVGATLRQGRPNYMLNRSAVTLETPDGTVPLPSNNDYRQVDLRALENRSKVMRDSIAYFPPGASDACRIGFFSEISSRTVAYDDVELSPRRACLGRLYFKIPGGIKYGQHWLNVKFQQSLVKVPFRIFTKEEEKVLSKNWRDIKKQVDEAFKKGGKH
jgi:hypothetical protein